MNEHNEYNLLPGCYEHYKGGLYVVCTMVTHMRGQNGKMELLQNPLVVYRDLMPAQRHINGKFLTVMQNYALPISEFSGIVKKEDGTEVKRFIKI